MGSSSMVGGEAGRGPRLDRGSIGKSYHGIAARLDRIPAGKAVRVVLWLSGGICFCDSIDMNIAGPIIAQFLTQAGRTACRMRHLFPLLHWVIWLAA